MNSSRNLEDICYNCSISINRKEDGGGKKRPKDGTELCCILLRAIDGLLKGSSPHFLSVWWGLLSHFSRVRLCATPETAGHQAPPSLGFSRQEHWSGLPFPSPMHKSEKWKGSCSVVSDPQQPHGLQPSRLLHPWDFPGKSAGVGCHCLLHDED